MIEDIINKNIENLKYSSIDFRRLKNKKKYIGVLNLMPNKIETEIQLKDLLISTEKDIEIIFIRLRELNKESKYYDYVMQNYSLFDDIKHWLDGIIVTGAPLEKLDFDEVRYIEELNEMLEYTKDNIKSSLHICWGAQAALNYYYGINKVVESKKIFGVFNHDIVNKDILLDNIKSGFLTPHSRYTSLDKNDIEMNSKVKILAKTKEGFDNILKGCYKDYYLLGHCEYPKNTLKDEYLRDISRGIDIDIPKNYFINNNLLEDIEFTWEETAINIYKNWISQI